MSELSQVRVFAPSREILLPLIADRLRRYTERRRARHLRLPTYCPRRRDRRPGARQQRVLRGLDAGGRAGAFRHPRLAAGGLRPAWPGLGRAIAYHRVSPARPGRRPHHREDLGGHLQASHLGAPLPESSVRPTAPCWPPPRPSGPSSTMPPDSPTACPPRSSGRSRSSRARPGRVGIAKLQACGPPSLQPLNP